MNHFKRFACNFFDQKCIEFHFNVHIFPNSILLLIVLFFFVHHLCRSLCCIFIIIFLLFVEKDEEEKLEKKEIEMMTSKLMNEFFDFLTAILFTK